MMEYTVIWRIQVDGKDPREAAAAAHAIMVDPGEALMFEVFEKDPGELKGCIYADLNAEEEKDA